MELERLKEIIADISAFEDFIEKNEISFSVLPPQYYIQTEMKGIRILATGGSASNIELVKKAERNQCYVNVYGPTESTVVGRPSIGILKSKRINTGKVY